MDLEAALFEYLTTAGTNTQVVAGDRVYPMRLPEAGPTGVQYPAASFQRVTARRTYTFDTFEDTAASVEALIQFSCWSNSMLEAALLGDAVRADLSGFAGDMAGLAIGSSFVEMERDDYEPDTKVFRRLLDFRIRYEDDLSGVSS